MAATIMTVEFGTIHSYPSLEEILKLVMQFFEQIQKLTKHSCKLWHFGLD